MPITTDTGIHYLIFWDDECRVTSDAGCMFLQNGDVTHNGSEWNYGGFDNVVI